MTAENPVFNEEEFTGEIVSEEQFKKAPRALARASSEGRETAESADALFEQAIELLKEKNGATLDETAYQYFDNAFLSLYHKLSAIEASASEAIKNRVKNERPACTVHTPRGLIQYGLFLNPYTNQIHFSRQPLRD